MQMVQAVSRFGALFADWVFPATCAACNTGIERGAAFCEACRESLTPLPPSCSRCAQPTGSFAVTCRRCRIHPLPLDSIVAPWLYGGELATAIKRLKFNSDIAVARDLAPMWAPALAIAIGVHELDVIVPIPLHWRRRWQRGFDQNTILLQHAMRVAQLKTPVAFALRRHRHTPEQSRLPAAARQSNLVGAFDVPPRFQSAIAGKRVVLLDDVVTTGATMAAAARALRRAGATRIVGVCVARAE